MKNNFLRMMTLVALLAIMGCTSGNKAEKAADNDQPADSSAKTGDTAKMADADSGKTAAVVTPKTIIRPMNPVVGELHPEITGPDTDGETFRLSDYKGKVVMIDFWGNW